MKKITRIYINESIELNQVINLCDKKTHRIKNVMRLKVGDSILVFNGDGKEWTGIIEKIEKKSSSIKIYKLNRKSYKRYKESLILCFAPVKQIKTIVTASTEMGVDILQPVYTQNTVVKCDTLKIQSWIQEACEQSMRLDLPRIADPLSFDATIQKYEDSIIICDTKKNHNNLQKFSFDKIAIFVGPEGGFSEEEAKIYSKSKKILLCTNILRSETACIAALSYAKMCLLN